MRVLVTGGGGFIGSHVVDGLLEAGHDVRVLDNFSTGRRENLAATTEHIELVEGDIQSYERAHNAVRGCEAVFHLAALPSVPRSVADPLTSNATNVIGTLNVLLAARDSDVRRVIFASSSSVYGANPALPKCETQQTYPMSPYAVAKLAGEGYCRAFREVYELDTVVLRYFNVFGPRQDPISYYGGVIPKFITALLASRSPVIYGDGEQSRDFTFIDNVVQANLLALSLKPCDSMPVLNVAGGARVSLNAVLGMLQSLTDSTAQPIYDDPRPGDVKHSEADISLAEHVLGYQPLVAVEDGLAKTVEFYTSNLVTAIAA